LTVVAESIDRRGQIDKQFQRPIILRVSFPSCAAGLEFSTLSAFWALIGHSPFRENFVPRNADEAPEIAPARAPTALDLPNRNLR
jgi:hypothetical protein